MNGARRLILPMVAVSILVGIGIGLFLGWQVWPVTWYDTDPSDMRLQHQASWVVMASDSLAVTGDVDVARQRLSTLIDEETDWQWVANLVEQAAVNRDRNGDADGALRLRRMAQSLALPPFTGEEVTARPPASVIPPTAPGWLVILGSILLLALGLTLIIGLVGGIQSGIAVVRRPPYHVPPERRRYDATAPRVEEPVENPVEEDYDPPEPLHYAASPALYSPPTVVAPVEEDEAESAWEDAELSQEEESLLHLEDEGGAVVPEVIVPSRPAPEGALAQFEAEYQYGDDDLDVSYSIESSDGEFLGECGLSVADILEVDEVQQIDAFEVWLFDKGDIRTVSKIIVSDLVHDDDELRQRMEEKGELVVARPGAIIELETISLRMEARIVDYRYRDDADLFDAVFKFLRVELTVFEPEDE
jgi:hypothetical protein